MSFVDLLRRSRSTPISVVHKFLLSYDASGDRVHAFVEGTADLAFYRNYLEIYVPPGKLRIYNCEGKANVYSAFVKIRERFPQCRRVAFFVDKDIDDILGEPWPVDPRIYVTDYYAIENYLVCREVVRRFFSDFVKSRKVEFDYDLILQQFDAQLQGFYRAVLPIMGWVVVVRRGGRRPILNDVNLSEILTWSDAGVVRRKGVRMLSYLSRVAQVQSRPGEWRQIRRVCRELHRLQPKRYVRGKFEAWFLLGFTRRLLEGLSATARESGGSLSISAQLTDSNFVQLLVRGLAPPQPLTSFLEFHFKSAVQREASERVPTTRRGLWRRAIDWLQR